MYHFVEQMQKHVYYVLPIFDHVIYSNIHELFILEKKSKYQFVFSKIYFSTFVICVKYNGVYI